jgi:hypothetical protein
MVRKRQVKLNAKKVAIHQYLNRHFPKKGVCEECGRECKTDYAFRFHPQSYTRDRRDYRELCRSCHFKADDEHRVNANREKKSCPRGHLYSGENLIVRKGGRRGCRECAKIHKRDYRVRVKDA